MLRSALARVDCAKLEPAQLIGTIIYDKFVGCAGLVYMAEYNAAGNISTVTYIRWNSDNQQYECMIIPVEHIELCELSQWLSSVHAVFCSYIEGMWVIHQGQVRRIKKITEEMVILVDVDGEVQGVYPIEDIHMTNATQTLNAECLLDKEYNDGDRIIL